LLLDQDEPMTERGDDDEPGYHGCYEPLAGDDPPGWVDGAPTSPLDQSCALCGSVQVVWVHPLDIALVTYREYGKGHTLPTFWTLCQRCEDLYQRPADLEIVEIMKASGGWFWESDEDVAECIQQPLAVFRRADRGGRPLGD
jgi:hypothetical protein